MNRAKNGQCKQEMNLMHFFSNPIGNIHGSLRVQFRKKLMKLKMFFVLLAIRESGRIHSQTSSSPVVGSTLKIIKIDMNFLVFMTTNKEVYKELYFEPK